MRITKIKWRNLPFVVSERVVTTEEGLRRALSLALNMEEGATGKNTLVASKGKGSDSPQKGPADSLTSAQGGLSDFLTTEQ